jgi:hypothetical protein
MHQVPCGVLHTKGSGLRLGTRIRRIIAFNVPFLRPPAAVLGLSESQPAQVDWADNPTYDAWLTGVYLNRELEWS